MDEIQNCIADAQYGEALRLASVVRPVERFPDPGPDFNPGEFGGEQHVNLKVALSEPLGGFFFNKFVSENKGSQEDMFVLECLFNIREFRRSADPNAAELVQNALRRLPIKFRRLKSFEVLSILSKAAELQRVGSFNNGSGAVDKDDVNVMEGDADAPPPLDAAQAAQAVEDAKKAAQMPVIESEDLIELENQLRQAVRQHWDPFSKSPLFDRYMRLKWYAEQTVSLKNFTIFRDLGRGAFGVVSGARFNTTGAMLAIKQMNKKLVKGKKALRLVQAEKSILEMLGNKPSLFTIWLQYSWSDKEYFYLALPLATGGDLAYHLSYEGYFPVERSRFTAAEIVLGLGHLHSLGIIYRDLKPENVLLEDSGHARISDMGLAIHADGRSIKGRAGTPGYWAPEMLRKEKYGIEADWWSFGCVLYEFLSGRCPYSKQNTGMERDEATLNWELTFPTHCNMAAVQGDVAKPPPTGAPPFPEDAKDLIRKLLNRDAEKRLGYGKRGTEDVKAHPFFASIDWVKLSKHALEPPWIPRPLAINAVNQSELDEKNAEYDYRKLKLTDADDIPNFFYVSTFAHQSDIVNVLQLEADGKLEYQDRSSAPFLCCSLS